MIITSLIFLLLSNSITLRRDKSILYSRATITILLISAFIAYDNLFFLFLNKGIGIFSGLFTTTATTTVFIIFIPILAILLLAIHLILGPHNPYQEKERALFSLCNPNPHKFNSVCLQSGGWDKKSIQELFSEMKQNLPLYKNSVESHRSARDELKIFRKAKSLEDKIANKSLNREMNEIMSHYETYFDEESGNSRKEGIQQLQEYLEGEAKSSFNTYTTVKLKLDQIKQEIDKRKAVENKKDIEEKKAVENQKVVEDTEKAVDEHKNTVL